MIQYTAYYTGILPQTTVTAATKAISDKPTIIIVFQVSSGAAAGTLLKQSGIPVLQAASEVVAPEGHHPKVSRW